MKISNADPPGGKAARATRGTSSTQVAGSKGMTWRDASTESIGQNWDITVVGADYHDNEDGSGILTIGGAGGGAPGTDYVGSSGGGLSVMYVIAASGAALTLDLDLANVFDITLTANLTLTFSGSPTAGRAAEWKIILRQGGSGGYTVTWPAAVQWQDTDGTPGGPAATLYTAVGAIDVIQIVTLDGGGTYGAASVRGGGSSVGDLDDLSDVVISSPLDKQRLRYSTVDNLWHNSSLVWEMHVSYDGTAVLDGAGNPVQTEVTY